MDEGRRESNGQCLGLGLWAKVRVPMRLWWCLVRDPTRAFGANRFAASSYPGKQRSQLKRTRDRHSEAAAAARAVGHCGAVVPERPVFWRLLANASSDFDAVAANR